MLEQKKRFLELFKHSYQLTEYRFFKFSFKFFTIGLVLSVPQICLEIEKKSCFKRSKEKMVLKAKKRSPLAC